MFVHMLCSAQSTAGKLLGFIPTISVKNEKPLKLGVVVYRKNRCPPSTIVGKHSHFLFFYFCLDGHFLQCMSRDVSEKVNTFLKSRAVWESSHRLLKGAIVFADVVNDPRDAERTSEAQQVGHEAECDAEDEGPAERFP